MGNTSKAGGKALARTSVSPSKREAYDSALAALNTVRPDPHSWVCPRCHHESKEHTKAAQFQL